MLAERVQQFRIAALCIKSDREKLHICIEDLGMMLITAIRRRSRGAAEVASRLRASLFQWCQLI